MQPGLDLGKDKIPRRARHIERPKAFLAAAGQDNLLGRLLCYLSALSPDGSFGTDPVIELAVPPAQGPTEISKITFDEQGRMFVADRPAPTGAFDFEALSMPTLGRVLRYAVVGTIVSVKAAHRDEAA